MSPPWVAAAVRALVLAPLPGGFGSVTMGTVTARFLAGGRALMLAPLALAALALFIAGVVSVALIPVGVGLIVAPATFRGLRGLAQWHRDAAKHWSDVRIASPYRPVTGWWSALRDPASWRDLLWALADAPLGLALGLLPTSLAGWGLVWILVAPWVWAGGPLWVLLGLCALVVAALVAGPTLRLHAHFCAALLAPTRRELEERVDLLAETRAQSVAAAAAELRRIERDLHDGAQARLASVGMTIGLAEQLLPTDPGAAADLLAEARDVNGQALTDLRDLVRGIHPPVLAERGLGGAVEALAAGLPLAVDVQVDVGRDLADPVASAAYFAIAEALANVVKHSAATRVWVRAGQVGDRLVAVVGDDGRGGADPGEGLLGVARRLAAFDGKLSVVSPAGGPTTVEMELVCGSSSPKI